MGMRAPGMSMGGLPVTMMGDRNRQRADAGFDLLATFGASWAADYQNPDYAAVVGPDGNYAWLNELNEPPTDSQNIQLCPNNVLGGAWEGLAEWDVANTGPAYAATIINGRPASAAYMAGNYLVGGGTMTADFLFACVISGCTGSGQKFITENSLTGGDDLFVYSPNLKRYVWGAGGTSNNWLGTETASATHRLIIQRTGQLVTIYEGGISLGTIDNGPVLPWTVNTWGVDASTDPVGHLWPGAIGRTLAFDGTLSGYPTVDAALIANIDALLKTQYGL